MSKQTKSRYAPSIVGAVVALTFLSIPIVDGLQNSAVPQGNTASVVAAGSRPHARTAPPTPSARPQIKGPALLPLEERGLPGN